MYTTLILALLSFSLVWGQTITPSGLYLAFSSTGLQAPAQLVTNDVVNEVNSYTGWQTISGSTSSASYTFSDWKVSIALVSPQWKSSATNQLQIGWQEFNFTIESNYHVCASDWPNPCEDGNLYIYTTDIYTQLWLDVELDLTQNPPFANVSAVNLSFRNNGIEIYVHCTNTFCLIPVDDIASAVADNFQSDFQNAVEKAAETALKNLIAKFKTEFVLSDGLAINMESNWGLLPGNTGGENGFIIIPTSGGFYTDVDGTVTNPPFPPSFTPPTTYLQYPKQDFSITITEYFFQSFAWALSNLNFLNRVLTPSDVPSDSPVQLSSNDAFFQQVVPELTSYPNLSITVTTKLENMAAPTIDVNGIHLIGTNITFDFSLSNSTFSKHGWTLGNTFDIDFSLVASVTGNVIVFNASITNFTSSVTQEESDFGAVTTDGFVSLYQLLESQIKLPGFAVHLPDTFSLANPTLVWFTHYIGFGADFTYSQPNALVDPMPPTKPFKTITIVQ